jgi:beta-galactosidase
VKIHRSMRAGLLCLSLALAAASQAAAPRAEAGRQRLSLNEDWRFHLGDPEGFSAQLQYDVRPDIKESADGKVADAKPDEAEKLQRPATGLLKPWILPSGNAFLSDPARRLPRPASEPGLALPLLQAGFDERDWRKVTLPHDWAIEGPFLATGPYGGMGRLKTWGPAWYRKKLDIPASDKGKAIFLDIDGAMSHASIWLNGRLVGGWPYGYNSFRLNLTPYVKAGGANQLAIRLDNPAESARWYPGAGLYRNVWLTTTNPVHVGHWGTVVRTPEVSARSARVELAVTVDNDGDDHATLDVATELYALDDAGKRSGPGVATLPAQRLTLAGRSSATVHATASISRPRLWGPLPQQRPHRYVALTTVSRNGKAVDRYETPFGIRSLRFDANHGLFVNGEKILINGVNNHHDLGALGAAFNVRAAERQLEMLQAMGANAIRMSHNPPAPELLELTDRMGMLVMDEVFDSWERKKTPLDFHLIFPDWHEQDIRAMMRRDRNHPSIIMWSVGNEVGEQYTGEAGAALGTKLVAMARQEDATRPITVAMNYAKADMPLPATVDIIGLNYQGAGIRSLPGQFPAFHQAVPDKMILSTESASALSSRGEYQFPVPGVSSASVRPGAGGDPKRQQVSAYELFASDFGSSADRTWAAQDQNPYVAGEFVWTGWDYLGEPTPYYGARSSYSGIIDLAGFPKDRYFLYQSRWRPELPLAHLLPHWTWPERVGEVTPVHLFTSGDEAELFVNGVSQGRRKKAPYEYRLRWDYVVYQPGELSVIAYKNGKEWARSSVKTAQQAAALEARADRSSIAADGRDLSFVTLRVVDANGVTVPRASQRIRFTVEGAGELVATDNGDPSNLESFQSAERDAFNGLCLAIVRAKPGQRGAITVRAVAEGLRTASIELNSK